MKMLKTSMILLLVLMLSQFSLAETVTIEDELDLIINNLSEFKYRGMTLDLNEMSLKTETKALKQLEQDKKLASSKYRNAVNSTNKTQDVKNELKKAMNKSIEAWSKKVSEVNNLSYEISLFDTQTAHQKTLKKQSLRNSLITLKQNEFAIFYQKQVFEQSTQAFEATKQQFSEGLITLADFQSKLDLYNGQKAAYESAQYQLEYDKAVLKIDYEYEGDLEELLHKIDINEMLPEQMSLTTEEIYTSWQLKSPEYLIQKKADEEKAAHLKRLQEANIEEASSDLSDEIAKDQLARKKSDLTHRLALNKSILTYRKAYEQLKFDTWAMADDGNTYVVNQLKYDQGLMTKAEWINYLNDRQNTLNQYNQNILNAIQSTDQLLNQKNGLTGEML